MPLRIINLLTRAALLLLLLHAAAFLGLPQYQGKGIGTRLLTFPLSTLIVPAAWVLTSRLRRWRYRYLFDLCVAVPFLIDTVGNGVRPARPGSPSMGTSRANGHRKRARAATPESDASP